MDWYFFDDEKLKGAYERAQEELEEKRICMAMSILIFECLSGNFLRIVMRSQYHVTVKTGEVIG